MFAVGLADAPKHRTPRLLLNRELVGGWGSRPGDCAVLGDIETGVETLCDRLGWAEDLLEVQIENEMRLADMDD